MEGTAYKRVVGVEMETVSKKKKDHYRGRRTLHMECGESKKADKAMRIGRQKTLDHKRKHVVEGRGGIQNPSLAKDQGERRGT